ncbi:CDGSH iron-sulfur domain-containing protein [Actinacidiphila oryziradicis]|uniref:CDGSH iron-sulfur domain-containing protein n=2 Tax=Actinacidiphila oryziradicis TaxID=2571141 RepID=A0A4U0SHT7_9ACTN|nr:CDGSH iron-sulfur domain-containing protein [Actinacidiphila oryziradicis]
MLVEGPVTVTGDDGVSVTSHRFVVAVCTCRRSRSYPWCDTSHRPRTQGPAKADGGVGTGADGDDRCGDYSDDETGGDLR